MLGADWLCRTLPPPAEQSCMNALEWLSTTDKPPVRPVYAVYGDDSYLIRESIRAIAFNLFPDDEERESAISRFAGPTSWLANVLDEVSTLPFFSRRRLVIVDDADPFVTKYRRELENYLENPCESSSLLLQ